MNREPVHPAHRFPALAGSPAQATLAGLLAFVLYTATLAPTVLWGDDAQLQREAVLGLTEGGSRSYALWVGVVHWFTRLPFGEPAWRVQFACGTFAALTVGIVHLSLRRLKLSAAGAWTGSAALAVSHTFWLHAVRAEVYSLLLLLLATACALLTPGTAPRPEPAARVLAAIAFLVAAVVHPLAWTLFPGFLLLLVARRGPRRGRVVLLAGTLLGAAVLVAAAVRTGAGTTGGLSVAARGLFTLAPSDLTRAGAYLVYQFGLLLPLAGVGLAAWWREDRELAVATAVAFLGNALFALGFRVPDQYVFFLPAYLVCALWIGRGAESLAARAAHRSRATAGLLGLAVVNVVLYAAMPSILERTRFEPVHVRDLPGRDNARYFYTPAKSGEVSARRFGEAVFTALPQNAAVLADWLPLQTLRYMQAVEGRRPDVLLEEATTGEGQVRWLVEQSRARPVFIADDEAYYDMNGIRLSFEVERDGPIFRLRSRGRSNPVGGSP